MIVINKYILWLYIYIWNYLFYYLYKIWCDNILMDGVIYEVLDSNGSMNIFQGGH